MKVETQFILFPVNPAVIRLLLFTSFYISNINWLFRLLLSCTVGGAVPQV